MTTSSTPGKTGKLSCIGSSKSSKKLSTIKLKDQKTEETKKSKQAYVNLEKEEEDVILERSNEFGSLGSFQRVGTSQHEENDEFIVVDSLTSSQKFEGYENAVAFVENVYHGNIKFVVSMERLKFLSLVFKEYVTPELRFFMWIIISDCDKYAHHFRIETNTEVVEKKPETKQIYINEKISTKPTKGKLKHTSQFIGTDSKSIFEAECKKNSEWFKQTAKTMLSTIEPAKAEAYGARAYEVLKRYILMKTQPPSFRNFKPSAYLLIPIVYLFSQAWDRFRLADEKKLDDPLQIRLHNVYKEYYKASLNTENDLIQLLYSIFEACVEGHHYLKSLINFESQWKELMEQISWNDDSFSKHLVKAENQELLDCFENFITLNFKWTDPDAASEELKFPKAAIHKFPFIYDMFFIFGNMLVIYYLTQVLVKYKEAYLEAEKEDRVGEFLDKYFLTSILNRKILYSLTESKTINRYFGREKTH